MSNRGFGGGDELAYEVVVASDASAKETTAGSGLSHPAAMRLAEELQADGCIARVMHVIAAGRFEVDRYPVR